MLNILLIEDDLEFAQLISDFLLARSIKTVIEDDPFKALVYKLSEYDLVLLDLGLPGIDGLEICREFRKKSKIPIIISSARSATTDKVAALQIGADDYLPKPYDPDELLARITSLIRRVKDFEEEKRDSKKDFEIDDNARDIKYLENYLFLTEAEFEVCKTLVKNYGLIVSKEQLLYSSPSIQSSNGKSLEMIISKIRQKIKPFSNATHIVASRGRGYRIV